LKSTDHYVRAVSGGQTGYDVNNMMVVDNNTGTVTDRRTGLMWQQQAAGPHTWVDALTYCETLNLAGYEDWRLPNLRELQSIVDFNQHGPAAEQSYFPDISQYADYWSSTRLIDPTNDTPSNFRVWCISFNTGYTCDENGQTGRSLVRAVRGGQ
jgi:hypothetical protein